MAIKSKVSEREYDNDGVHAVAQRALEKDKLYISVSCDVLNEQQPLEVLGPCTLSGSEIDALIEILAAIRHDFLP